MTDFTQKKLAEFREKFTSKHVPERFRKFTNVTVEEVEGFLAAAIREAQAEERKRIVTFTDKELEYIYCYCDCDVEEELFREIEKKIRKQIKRYRDFDKKRAGLSQQKDV